MGSKPPITKPNPLARQSPSIASMIRVDYAGEYGAARIYQGQIDALAHHPVVDTLQHMKDQEQAHLDYFDNLMGTYHVRPSIFMGLWDKLGYGIGWVTGRMGPAAAMAVTKGVESEIINHYQRQYNSLHPHMGDPVLRDIALTIKAFAHDEDDHFKQADDYIKPTFSLRVIEHVSRGFSRMAIYLSERF